ncbi:MAG TPA: DNA-directed RNA polymerase subunit K [Thermoplasmatales archaeon]|nr:DNA-directed RNA polymerase subunit K [Thermoplasmatales archaeon]
MRYTRFEKARIIGARALQIAMGAPVLIKVPKDMVDPVKIAMLEFEKNAIPITVKRKTDLRLLK